MIVFRRHIIYISLCLLSISATYGQGLSSDTVFFNAVIQEWKPGNQLTYVKTVDTINFPIHRFKDRIRQGIIKNKQDTIILTKSEQHYLVKVLSETVTWPERLTDGSQCIQADSLWRYIGLERQKKTLRVESLKDSLQKAISNKDIQTIEQITQNPYVFLFKKPVYFRDNNICLVTYLTFCGGQCGGGGGYFYKKDLNGRWYKWLVLTATVF